MTTTTTHEPGAGLDAGPDPALDPRLDPGLDPVTMLAALASSEPDASAELDGLRALPGLAARLARMGAELRLLTRSFPTWCMPETGVGDALEQAQAVRELAHSLCAVLAGEVTSRSLGARDGLSRNDWVAAQAPVLEGAGAAELTAVGAIMTEPRWRELAGKVRSGAATVAKAAVVVRFHDEVVGFADREHLDSVVDSMVGEVEVLGVRELRRLVRRARATLRPPEQVASEEARLRAGRALSRVGRSAGLVEYRLRLDPEGAAVLDAAIDPLARPRPDLDWDSHLVPYRHPVCGHLIQRRGEPGEGAHEERAAGVNALESACQVCASLPADPRLPATRRADALLELVGRAVSAPQGVTRSPRTRLVVTMSLEALLGQVRGAGLAGDDEVLSAGVVRRLACEAEIIPVVLGAPSRVLDLGSSVRFFSPAQRVAMALRDKGCSYPGCTVPPQWCEAHHVEPWSTGGPTDLGNGALLCGRHHTRVHELGLSAEVTPWEVTWHRPPPPQERRSRAAMTPKPKPGRPGRARNLAGAGPNKAPNGAPNKDPNKDPNKAWNLAVTETGPAPP